MTIVKDDVVYIHRLYNPNSGEHFYTASRDEADALERIGWSYEYIGWCAPSYGGDPIYRLYNPNAGDHHYTMNEAEKRMLIAFGWRDEGILCNSAPEGPGTVQILRSYNPNAVTGSHNFTSNGTEYAHLESVGWRSEGVAWYGIDAPIPE